MLDWNTEVYEAGGYEDSELNEAKFSCRWREYGNPTDIRDWDIFIVHNIG